MALREQSIPLQVSRSRGSLTVSITQPPPGRSQLLFSACHLQPLTPHHQGIALCRLPSRRPPGSLPAFLSGPLNLFPIPGHCDQPLNRLLSSTHSSRSSLKSIASRIKVTSSIYRGVLAETTVGVWLHLPHSVRFISTDLLSACILASPSIVIRSVLPLL
jgi:hypothetical protein